MIIGMWDPRSAVGAEGGVEGGLGWVEGEPADVLEGFGRPDEAVHAGVLPFDGDGAGVSDGVEHPKRLLPWDVTVPGRHEVPAATRVGPWQVAAEPPVATVAGLPLGVLAVDVIDPVAEVVEEADR